MNIEFLLSFKDLPELAKLDSSFIKSLPDNFIKVYSKKVKKKIIKPISKSNILKNSKLQSAKNKDENKVNMILNKLSEDNIDNIIKEFLETFVDIDQDQYNIILQTIYLKLIKDDKFIYVYYKFYNIINSIYTSLFDLENKHFIDIIQTKIMYDYADLNLNDNFSYLKRIKTEENRINNLKLIVLLIESNNFDKKITKEITPILLKKNYIPDLVFWFNHETIKKSISINNFYDTLVNKLNNDMNNRSVILLKNLLNIEDDIDEIEDDSSVNSEDSCMISVKEENNKSSFQIEVDNIIEEFLLLEEPEEIIDFIKDFSSNKKNIKIFTTTLLDCYFNSKLNTNSKFKKLFVSLKKSKLIDNSIFRSSLSELVSSENKLDYNNFDKKLTKIIEIYKIVSINLNKDFINTLV